MQTWHTQWLVQNLVQHSGVSGFSNGLQILVWHDFRSLFGSLEHAPSAHVQVCSWDSSTRSISDLKQSQHTDEGSGSVCNDYGSACLLHAPVLPCSHLYFFRLLLSAMSSDLTYHGMLFVVFNTSGQRVCSVKLERNYLKMLFLCIHIRFPVNWDLQEVLIANCTWWVKHQPCDASTSERCWTSVSVWVASFTQSFTCLNYLSILAPVHTIASSCVHPW